MTDVFKRLNNFFWDYLMSYGVGLAIALGLCWLITSDPSALYSDLISGAAIWGVVVGTAMGTALNLLYWAMLVNRGKTAAAKTPAFLASVNIALFLMALVFPALTHVSAISDPFLVPATGILVGVAVGLLYMAIYLPVNMASAFHALESE